MTYAASPRNAPRRLVLQTGSIEFADTAIECAVRDPGWGPAYKS
jgi:hypothetical protein